MPPPDVVGLTEIAVLLGRGRRYARDVAESAGFPEGTKLSMGWVWNRGEVVDYIARRWPDRIR